MSKRYIMAIPANELISADKAGLDALIAQNPDAYADGTFIKIVGGTDDPPTPGNDLLAYVVLSTKVVLSLI